MDTTSLYIIMKAAKWKAPVSSTSSIENSKLFRGLLTQRL